MLLRPSEALSLAERLGIPVPPWEDEVKAPAYVKADLPIPHKTEVKAVDFAKNEEELRELVKKMKERFGDVLVQEAVEGDLELLVSMKKDPVFGKVLVLAVGGIYASLLKESVVTLCPFCKPSFEIKLKERKVGKILTFRKKLDVECVWKVLKRLCSADVKVFEVNPLIVSERGCWAVDVKVWT